MMLARNLIARHEAGHALAMALLLPHVDWSVTIAPTEQERAAGTLGRARTDRQRAPGEVPLGVADTATVDALLLLHAAIQYAGVAAEAPRATGVPVALLARSESDRRAFVTEAAGLGRRAAAVDWQAFAVACHVVDRHRSRLLAIAEAIEARGTLRGGEVREIVDQTPIGAANARPWPPGAREADPSWRPSWPLLEALESVSLVAAARVSK